MVAVSLAVPDAFLDFTGGVVGPSYIATRPGCTRWSCPGCGDVMKRSGPRRQRGKPPRGSLAGLTPGRAGAAGFLGDLQRALVGDPALLVGSITGGHGRWRYWGMMRASSAGDLPLKRQVSRWYFATLAVICQITSLTVRLCVPTRPAQPADRSTYLPRRARNQGRVSGAHTSRGFFRSLPMKISTHLNLPRLTRRSIASTRLRAPFPLTCFARLGRHGDAGPATTRGRLDVKEPEAREQPPIMPRSPQQMPPDPFSDQWRHRISSRERRIPVIIGSPKGIPLA